jgi:glycosyltransferase involved in cell wall biosynthesis
LTAPVTTIIFTLNEEVNLPRCLASLAWCDDVIVVDSFSSDGTEMLARAAGARVFKNRFEGFGTQRNWALDHCAPRHAWVLVLDADERTPPELVAEFAAKLPDAPPTVAAFRVKRRFHLWGRWLRHSSLYPTWVVRLVRVGRVRFEDRGHAETQAVEGETRAFDSDLIDENQKGIVEWFQRQARYAEREAAFELAAETGRDSLTEAFAPDPLVRRAALKRLAGRLPGRALLYFGYSFVVRGGFRDGIDGMVFCGMRAVYQQMIVAAKHELRRTGHSLR